ncbi:hypothetical protein SNEBB_004751 [Seison nebaliae]|nr:hypothetical protein SNEBB_004751 [Seison nebaliae]
MRENVEIASKNESIFKSTEHFEGPEKFLEMVFNSTSHHSDKCNLRLIPVVKWKRILKEMNCHIIQSCSNDVTDSYILSESSMFVTKQRLILKTCGTTILFKSFKSIVSTVIEETDLNILEDLYYSRRRWSRPDLQLYPHSTIEQEIEFLDKHLPKASAYVIGSFNSDYWFMYSITSPHQISYDHDSHQFKFNPLIQLPTMTHIQLHERYDQCLEILMLDLDEHVCTNFYKRSGNSIEDINKLLNLNKTFPQCEIDEFLFEPCGYSMNGIFPENDTHYLTIHVTPEKEFSYASFETNVWMDGTKRINEMIREIISIFRARIVQVALFNNEKARRMLINQIGSCDFMKDQSYENYCLIDCQMCMMHAYQVNYLKFEKKQK